MRPSERLFSVTRARQIPLLCTFELTRRCNLHCQHCYLTAPASGKQLRELTTTQVFTILRQLADAGTLYLVFTGGEIFLRTDLLQIVAEARRLAFDVRLFTNATRIAEMQAAALAEQHISGIDISLYGRQKTHDMITRVPGSFRQSTHMIRILRNHGIPVTIKAPLMRLNIHDRPWLERFAASLGARAAFDPTITVRNDGSRSVLRHRLSAPQMKQLYHEPEFMPAPPSPGMVPDFSCSAAENLLAIAADGTLYPCLQLPVALGNLTRKPLSHLWRQGNTKLASLRRTLARGPKECRSCRHVLYCQRCPGMALLEEGSITKPSKIAGKVATIHHHLFTKNASKHTTLSS